MSNSKKCLLFCPSFFSYDEEIKSAIERLGYNVVLHDERPFRSVFGKSLIRLGFNSALNVLIDKYYNNIFDDIDDDIDVLFLVNPECFTPSLISLYRKKCKHVIVYMWDSFRNKKNSDKLIDYSDSFFTFDPHDAEEYHINFKPLFYVPDYIGEPSNGSELYDVSFIGTAHSSRFKFVSNITRGHSKSLFFYCPSKVVFFIKKFVFNELSGMKIRDVSFSPLNRKEVIEILRTSKSTIDIAHPKQQGLTMRSIESIGIQRKLITTNKNVLSYDFYNESNVLVVDEKTNKSVIDDFLNSSYISPSKEIYSKYYIDNWVRDLFKEVLAHD